MLEGETSNIHTYKKLLNIIATTTKSNSNLNNARKAKNDEFYTQLIDIEKEMCFYKDFFKGKVVYCNCDDARESNFFKYFSMNFEYLGLKKLITTGFKQNGKGVFLIYEGKTDKNQVNELNGNGDFRSEECIEFLKQADVVVTNPPFSLFREYVAQLMKYGKKFLIIGNMNAVAYKVIFKYIKNNELWLGQNVKGGTRKGNSLSFATPNGETKDVSSWWYTNIDCQRRNETLDLYRKYNETDYPKYDNYDAIECGRMSEFPINYNGVIGIPISGLKYLWSDGKIHIKINGQDTQFEIVNISNMSGVSDKYWAMINGKPKYPRIFIRKKF